jgi:UDP-3-O-[3-hydroxymyristoyl] glucosamine N-acyltransferase
MPSVPAGHFGNGDGIFASGSTQVCESINVAGVCTGMFPGLPHREWWHVASKFRPLRELADRVRALERRAGAVAGAEGTHKEEP